MCARVSSSWWYDLAKVRVASSSPVSLFYFRSLVFTRLLFLPKALLLGWFISEYKTLYVFVIRIQILGLMGCYFLRHINIFVINARKQRPIKCHDKHNFCSFSIMDLHSLIIYHLIKFFLKLIHVRHQRFFRRNDKVNLFFAEVKC